MSVLVHVWLAMAVTSGPGGRFSGVAPAPVITARLVALSAPTLDTPLAELATLFEPVPLAARMESASREPTRTEKLESGPATSSGIANAPDATYYAARELDVYPVLKMPLDLHSRPAAEGIHGRALLVVRIDSQGIVEEVNVVEAEPTGYIEEEARQAFLSARFTPALKNGRAVKSRILIRVDYGGEPGTP